ncbi:MAG: GIY-YIG nuclease family protein [Halanaerobiales bacterium]
MSDELKVNVDYNQGIYLLEVFLHKPKKIEVGALGIHPFPPGYYYYSGSAQKNLKARIERHKYGGEKKHWHIDYLLEVGHFKRFFTWQINKYGECKLAQYLKQRLGGEIILSGFGSSDCNCESHLIYFNNPLKEKNIPAKEEIEEIDIEG